MEDERKIPWIKATTIIAAQVALTLVILLFIAEVTITPVLAMILGIFAIAAVAYLGLIGFESIGTELENLRISKKANRVIETVAESDKYFEDIFKRIDQSELKQEKAIKGIASSLQMIMDAIELKKTVEEAQNSPKKKK